MFDSMLDKISVVWNINYGFATSDKQIFIRRSTELPINGYNSDLLLKGLYNHEKLDVYRSLVDARKHSPCLGGDGRLCTIVCLNYMMGLFDRGFSQTCKDTVT